MNLRRAFHRPQELLHRILRPRSNILPYQPESTAETLVSDGDVARNNFNVKVDYSDFNVMGQLYPESDYLNGKPFTAIKVRKDIQGIIVGIGGVLFNSTPGMRLYDIKTNALVLVDAEEAFKHGDYSTCSYTWKHDPVEQDIQVKSMIERIREEYNTVRFLWIDAWCINQDSEEDKIFNIELMGRIFRYSSRTFIILLDSVLGSDIGTYLKDIGVWTKYMLSMSNTEDPEKKFLSRLIEEGGHNIVKWSCDLSGPWEQLSWNHDTFQLLVAAILQISSHRWVTRMWTFQEAVLGANNAVIGANWSCLYEAFEYGVGILDWYYRKHSEEWKETSVTRLEAEFMLADLISASKQWRRLYHITPDIRVGDIIQRARGRTCGLEEDRIYAIKGLLPYGDQIEVEYGHPEGAANAAHCLARVSCRNGDYTWAVGFNMDGFLGNTSAVGIPGITAMPPWIGLWNAIEAISSTEISSAGVIRSGRVSKLEAGSLMMNTAARASFDFLEERLYEPSWKNIHMAAAAAILAAFAVGGFGNGFLSVDPNSETWENLRVTGNLSVYDCTKEEVHECAVYLISLVGLLSPPVEKPESITRVLKGVARALEKALPYGCRKAGIVRVRRYGENSGREMSQLCNLLYWPLMEDITDICVLATGDFKGYETFNLVHRGPHGIFRRVGIAIALFEGNISEFWGEEQPVVEA